MFSVLNFPYLLCRYNCKWKTSEMFRLGWAKDTKPIGLDASSRYVVQQTTCPKYANETVQMTANMTETPTNREKSCPICKFMQIDPKLFSIPDTFPEYPEIMQKYAGICKCQPLPDKSNQIHFNANHSNISNLLIPLMIRIDKKKRQQRSQRPSNWKRRK